MLQLTARPMRLPTIVCTLLVSLGAQADRVTFVMRIANGKSIAETAVLVVAPQADGAREPIRIEATIPGTTEVDLARDVQWNVQLESDRFWTRTLLIDLREAQEYALDVVPAGVIKGRLLDEQGAVADADVILAFTPAGEPFPLAPDTSRCRTDDMGRF